MAKKRRYHPLVANYLSSATTYYDEIASELGNRFRASVRNLLRTVADRPESFARVHDQMRAALVDRFPYVVIFEDHSDSVTILGIFHAASDQQGWFTRST
jgi:plasmid stabilization system protein ParE